MNNITATSTASKSARAPRPIAIGFVEDLPAAAFAGIGNLFDAAAAAAGDNGHRAEGFCEGGGVVDSGVVPPDGGGIVIGGIATVPGGVVAMSSGSSERPESVSIGRPASPRLSASRN